MIFQNISLVNIQDEIRKYWIIVESTSLFKNILWCSFEVNIFFDLLGYWNSFINMLYIIKRNCTLWDAKLLSGMSYVYVLRPLMINIYWIFLKIKCNHAQWTLSCMYTFCTNVYQFRTDASAKVGCLDPSS